jgi:hypothetical protein
MIEFNIDCKNVKTKKDLHIELKNKLAFPDFYGENFGALDDSLLEFFTDYIDYLKPGIKKRLVFKFIGYENAIASIGEHEFQLFIDAFYDAIKYWHERVEAEVRLVNS